MGFEMSKHDFDVLASLIVGCFAGGLIGVILGCHSQMKADENRLKKLGIQIIETRVFNGEPEYSYKIVEPIKKEEGGK